MGGGKLRYFVQEYFGDRLLERQKYDKEKISFISLNDAKGAAFKLYHQRMDRNGVASPRLPRRYIDWEIYHVRISEDQSGQDFLYIISPSNRPHDNFAKV